MIPVMVVPVLARYELLYRMLESIDCTVDSLVIVDNGDQISRHIVSAINTDYIRRRHVLKMPSNLGVPTSWNLGIKSTPFAPWWMVANFDITWPAGALAMFAAHSQTDAVVVSGEQAEWCAFTIGEEVVERVGFLTKASTLPTGRTLTTRGAVRLLGCQLSAAAYWSTTPTPAR
jgi:hypothetical protein